MSRKRIVVVGLVLFIVAAGYIFTALNFPKYVGRYPFLLLLFAADIYVWGLFRRKVFTYNKTLKAASAILYWSPLLLIAGQFILRILIPSNPLPASVNTLLWGCVFSFYVAKLFSALVLFLSDLLRFILQLSRPKTQDDQSENQPVKHRLSRRRFLETLSLATGGLVLSTLFTGMFRWVHDFNLKRVSVKAPDLPPSFENYRIVQISDLHLGSWWGADDLEQAIHEINNVQPDLVVFTGDLVNFRTDEALRFRDTLKKLRTKDGVLATLGNHDYGDYVRWESQVKKQQNMRDLYGFYNEIGWKLLRNEHYILSRGDDKLAVLGVENWGSNPRFPQLGDIEKAAKGLGPIKPLILLSHDPSHWEAKVLKNHPEIFLTLAGHTHGFQFGIEIPGIKWSPAKYLYKQWAGLYENPESGQLLYVNRGLGSIGYPGRIGILPEITIFDFQI